MNKIHKILLVCLSLLSSLVLFAQTPLQHNLQHKLQVGLIFHTPFSVNTTDSSRYKQVAEVAGTEIRENSRCGMPAIYFDGKDDMIDYGKHIALDRKMREMTVSVWLKPQKVDFTTDFFGLIVGRWAFDAKKDQFALFINSRSKIVFAVGDGTNDSDGVYTHTSLNGDMWYHVVVKWQYPNKVQFYVNGKLDSEGIEDKVTGMNVATDISLKVGRQLVKYNRAYEGYMSGLRIYNRGLSEEEIKGLYDYENSKCITFTLEGSLLNANTQYPIDVPAEIFIKDLKTGADVMRIQSDSVDGYYRITLPVGFQYGIFAKAQDYRYISVNQSVDTRIVDKKTKSRTGIVEEILFKRDLMMVPFDIGGKVRANNLFFETNKSDLQTESFAELDQMLQMFKDIPTLILEIGGHTDNVGSPPTNQKLSEARANSVRNYLISKGVDQSRLSAKGYGEAKPITTNDNDEGRATNRRVEFTILQK